MTGTGIVSDPYVITSWADMEAVTDSTAYYKLGCDLDANDRNGGVWSALTLRAAHIDGNGKTISNILAADPSIAGLIIPAAIAIDNIAIVDTQLVGTFLSYTINGGYEIVFTNSQIAAKSSVSLTSVSSTGYANGVSCENCSISFDGHFDGYAGGWQWIPLGTATKLTRCRLRMDIAYIGAFNGRQLLSAPVSSRKWETVLVEGKIGRSTAGDIEISASNSAIILDCDDVTKVWLKGAAGSISVMDSTLAGCPFDLTHAAALTTSQMQSYDALTAAGFPVVMYT